MSGSCRQVSSMDDGSNCILGFIPDTPAGPSQTITYDPPILVPQSWKPGALLTEPTKSQKTGGSNNYCISLKKRISGKYEFNQCSGNLPVLPCMSGTA